MRRVRVGPAFAAALVALLLAATAADAATTIGPETPNPTPSGAFAEAFPTGALLFTDYGPIGTTYRTPGAGTITSWRFYTDKVGAGATAQLYALVSPAEDGDYMVAATGPKESLTAVEPLGAEAKNVLHSYTGEIAVPAGAYLGVRLEYPSGSTVEPVYYETGTWLSACLGSTFCPPVPAEGATSETARAIGIQLALNATFEPASGSSGGETAPTGTGSTTGTATTTPAPAATTTTTVARTTAKQVTCKKGKKLVKGKCVKKAKKAKKHSKKKAGKKK